MSLASVVETGASLFDPALLWPIGAIIILLMFSGFFSGSETALTAVSRARMHQLEGEGDKRAARVTHLVADRESLIGAILLGNNIVNILASALATYVFLRVFGQAGVGVATLVMTALVVIFAEVLPKTYAISSTERMAMGVSGPITVIVKLFGPVVAAIQVIVRGALRLFGVRAEGDVLSFHEEMRGHIELHHKEGAVEETDKAMLGGILDLRDYNVADVMVHRKSMEMIDADEDPRTAVDMALESRHTRIPLWKDDAENIVGVLHAKDLSRALNAANGDLSKIDLEKIAREPWFVPETTSLFEQLAAFRAKREHFALVVDEYGALMGLVTLEDILEEIVGEIHDEYDRPVEGVVLQQDGSYLVDGSVTIRDLNRALDWALPDDEAVTVAGLVIHEAQTIPEPGQVFSFYDRRFEITGRRRNQLTQLRVSTLPTEKTA
ncbi:MAG: HlyC/CorC family transporter [Maricaulaceae bacterium]|jgi:Mg2+/Co2+ transporter CorB